MIGINVKGGTGAGRKRQKPAPKPWTCGCVRRSTMGPHPRQQPAYLARCNDCGTERP